MEGPGGQLRAAAPAAPAAPARRASSQRPRPAAAADAPHLPPARSVFILDYSSEVEVTNCTNCQIFIGAPAADAPAAAQPRGGRPRAPPSAAARARPGPCHPARRPGGRPRHL